MMHAAQFFWRAVPAAELLPALGQSMVRVPLLPKRCSLQLLVMATPMWHHHSRELSGMCSLAVVLLTASRGDRGFRAESKYT